MIRIADTIFINEDTLEVHDTQFGNGESPVTEGDIRQIMIDAERMNCEAPRFIVIYNYIDLNSKEEIKNNLEYHVEKMKELL